MSKLQRQAMLTKATIRFNSVLHEMDLPIQFEMVFELPPDDPVLAYQQAKEAAIACLMDDGAQIDYSYPTAEPRENHHVH
ncbi:hypothetical protein [Picosynechococcus sp. PCC 8807]|uniref:hypothetical protein n=1 Tax=Picosynechococcus sp. PCC 8807 TaxID=195248 RepID=UPI0008107709|nr:hypothetical protein [Picosynechococcus sp. PCC 8807]ANV89222.1 hypothetical protein AWQ24_00360 [Picosynechococcus sp. PCC 8807]